MQNTLNKYTILLLPRAYHDLDDIYAYICNGILEPKIAKKQIGRIWEALNSLSIFPYSHQDRFFGKYANKGYKQLKVDNYLTIYSINEEKKEVRIVTIQYVKRNI